MVSHSEIQTQICLIATTVLKKMASRMEILDIAYVHYYERTAMSGNKELRLAIEDVKHDEVLGLKRIMCRTHSDGPPPPEAAQTVASSASAPAATSSKWMPPQVMPDYNPYPPAQPYPGYPFTEHKLREIIQQEVASVAMNQDI